MSVNGVGYNNAAAGAKTQQGAAKAKGKDDDMPEVWEGGKFDSGVSVDSFLKLLASQLQNQDFMNPMKDSEFMTQLAQFTTLQSMEDLNKVTQELNYTSVTAYVLSLVGKEVTAAEYDKEGNMKEVSGVVTGVSLTEGLPLFYIGDKKFSASQLMSVGKVPPKPDPPVTDPPKPDNGLPDADKDK